MRDDDHRIERVILPDGSDLGYTYSNAGDLIAFTDRAGEDTTFTYHQQMPHLLEDILDPRGVRAIRNEYDQEGRLIGQLDADGNRLSRTVTCTPAPCNGELDAGTNSYNYDANDRLLTETGPAGSTSYQYDANGNTLSKTGPDGTVDYHYNSDNRLVRATGSLGEDACDTRYTYDHRGIRQSQTVEGVTTRYLSDANREHAQVVEEHNSATQTTITWSYGNDRISLHNADGHFAYHADGLGSVRALTDSTGQLTDSYTYEAFGELEHSSGSTHNPFRYTGEQWDPNLGFYYLRARYYNPSNGRFPTMDTYQGRIHEPATLHKYLYVHGDPVNNIDPSGHMSLASISTGARVQSSIQSQSHLRYQYGARVVRKMARRIPRPFFMLKRKRGYERHHIIERRFMSNTALSESNYGTHMNLLAVHLTRAEHNPITQAWRRRLPYGPSEPYSLDRILRGAKSVCRSEPMMLAAATFQINLARMKE